MSTKKMMILSRRKPGLSMEEFRNYYDNEHVKVTNYFAGISRHIRRYVTEGWGARATPPLDFDVITEVWINDADAFDRSCAEMGEDIQKIITADEQKIFDSESIRIFFVDETYTDLPVKLS